MDSVVQLVQQNSTSVRLRVQLSSTTGAAMTGQVYNSGLKMAYFRDGDTVATAITPVVGTIGTWISGGWVEINSTTAPGLYEVGVPNAVFANAVNQSTFQVNSSSCYPFTINYQVVPWNPQSLANASTAVTVTGSVVASSVTNPVTVTGNVTVGGYALGKDPYTSVMQTVDSVDNLTNADTLEKRIRIFASVLLGKVSGMGANAPIFRNITDTKNRITATSDSIGDRTAVTLDGS